MATSGAAESFLYIWYDTKNKMFYLGKHKGTPDDSYTHSSSMMESFSKDNIPSYMRRRILACGTDEEMCLLEHECLKNRKQKKWDRYYNVWLGDPRYVVLKGEDHPSYKHGLSKDPDYIRKRDRKYRAENGEHFREYKREWYAGRLEQERERQNKYRQENYERVIARERAYAENYRERRRETNKEYRERNRERLREYKREYRAKNNDKINEQQRLSYQKNKEKNNQRCREWRENNQEKVKEYQREYRAKKKAERLASGATLPI